MAYMKNVAKHELIAYVTLHLFTLEQSATNFAK